MMAAPGVSRSEETAGREGRSRPLTPDFDETFDRACAGGRPSSIRIRVADRVIRFRFASPATARPLSRALAHLRVDSGSHGLDHGTGASDEPVSLDIRVWDDASTGATTTLPSLPARSADTGGPYSGVYLYRFQDADAAYEPGPGMLSVLSGNARTGYLRAATGDGLTLREHASPARTILSWWAPRQGLRMVHAAAVGTARGGALLVGPSGSGKSTTALRCLDGGLDYVADDCCLVRDGDPPTLHALYATAKVEMRRADWFPRLEAEIRDAPPMLDGEALLHLETSGGALVRELPLRIVLVPEVGAAQTTVAPCRPARALAALAPSTIFQFPGSPDDTLARLADVVRGVPCHRLLLGPDVERIPAVIAEAIEASP